MRYFFFMVLLGACGGPSGGSGADPCGTAQTVTLNNNVNGRGFSLRTPDADVQCHAQMELLYRWPDDHTPLPKGVYGGPGDDIGMEFGISANTDGVYPVGTPSSYSDGTGTVWNRAYVDQGAKDLTSPGHYYISAATLAPMVVQGSITYRPWRTSGQCSQEGQGCGVGLVVPLACCDGLWCQNAMCAHFRKAEEPCGSLADPPCEPNVLACNGGKCVPTSTK